MHIFKLNSQNLQLNPQIREIFTYSWVKIAKSETQRGRQQNCVKGLG